jgi:mono/diheme cytochrome c family protein
VKPQQIAVLIVAATLGLLVVLLFAYGRPRRTAAEGLPANFSRGDPDSVLETVRLQRIMTWGVASAIFMAGFLSVYFVLEPFRENYWDKKFLRESIERGAFEFTEGVKCIACHGPKGVGGNAQTDISWPAPPLTNEFQRYTRTEVRRIVEMGRPGTPMPSWGIAFGGPLNDQRLDDVINYLESIQTGAAHKFELPETTTDGRDVFAQKCAVCHGQDAKGQAMGKPFPTFYAPDLTTEFYRLGIKVLREDAKSKDPTLTDDAARALVARKPLAEILTAGEQAARNTITKGRQNTPMPAWQNRIGPKQIDAVVGYLKSIQRQPS